MLSKLQEFQNRLRNYIRTRNELLTYSDRELDELGIGPRDIDRIAWEEAATNPPR